MDVDVWVRRAAIAAVPALALAVWLLRKPPPAPDAAAPVTARSAAPATPRPAAPLQNGERALAQRDAPPPPTPPAASPPPPASRPPPAHAAVDLPLAGAGPELPLPRGSAPHRHPLHASTHAHHEPASLCGGLEVRLITASDDPAWSFASIATDDDSDAHLRRVGDRVGNWRVTSIDWDRVWVQSGGTRCAVGMHVGAREAQAELHGKHDELLVPADDAPAWSVPEAIAAAIDKQSETEIEIGRAAVEQIYAHAAELLSGVQLRPVKRDETVVGIELATVPADSLFDRLGIERGDIVLALNDAPCTTLRGTLDALGQVRDKDSLVARLERDGQAFELSVRVR